MIRCGTMAGRCAGSAPRPPADAFAFASWRSPTDKLFTRGRCRHGNPPETSGPLPGSRHLALSPADCPLGTPPPPAAQRLDRAGLPRSFRAGHQRPSQPLRRGVDLGERAPMIGQGLSDFIGIGRNRKRRAVQDVPLLCERPAFSGRYQRVPVVHMCGHFRGTYPLTDRAFP